MGARRGRGEGSFELLPSGRVRAIISQVIDGQRVRESKTFDTKKQAIEWRDSRKGKVAKAGTLSEWLDTWLELINPDVASKTYEHDAWRVNKYLKPRIGEKRLRDLSTLVIRKMLTDMHKEGISDSERQKAGAVLRKALNSAVENGQLSASPMVRFKLPTPKRQEKRSLTPEEMTQFLERCGPLEYLYRLWFDSGLRPNELLALWWDDFDLERGTLRIRRALDPITNKPKEPKTRKSRRIITLTPATTAALLVARQSAVGNIFHPTPSGEYWWLSNFNGDQFSAIRKKSGITWITPYTFRHTMATLLIRAGVPIKVVSERLGHEDVATTLRTYAHVLEGDQTRAADEMAKLLCAPRKSHVKSNDKSVNDTTA